MKINYTKDEEIEMIRFLRFRKEDPKYSKRTFMGLRSIAKFIGKSMAYVHKISNELRHGKHTKGHDSKDNKPRIQRSQRKSISFEKYRLEFNKHFT